MSISIVGSGTVGSMTLGVYPRQLQFWVSSTVAGSTYVRRDITPYVTNDWQITQKLGEPSTLNFTLMNDTALLNAGLIRVTQVPPSSLTTTSSPTDFGDVLFEGNMLERRDVLRHVSQTVVSEIAAQDLTWQLNQTGGVTGTYGSVGFNTLVGQLLNQYNSVFVPGYISQGLGDSPELTFDNATLLEALQRVAETASAYLSVTPDRHVHVFQSADHLSQVNTITTTSRNAGNVSVYRDYTNTATEARVLGKGTTLATAVNSTRIYLQDVVSFIAPDYLPNDGLIPGFPGGAAINNAIQVGTEVASVYFVGRTYLAATEGYLELISSLSTAYPAGTQVRWFGRATNAAASLTLRDINDSIVRAARIVLDDNTSLARNEVGPRAAARASKISGGYEEITFTTDDERHDVARQVFPGARIHTAITSPASVSISSPAPVVQDVTIAVRGTVANSTVDIVRQVKAAPSVRTQTLDQVLAQTKTS